MVVGEGYSQAERSSEFRSARARNAARFRRNKHARTASHRLGAAPMAPYTPFHHLALPPKSMPGRLKQAASTQSSARGAIITHAVPSPQTIPAATNGHEPGPTPQISPSEPIATLCPPSQPRQTGRPKPGAAIELPQLVRVACRAQKNILCSLACCLLFPRVRPESQFSARPAGPVPAALDYSG